jgi:hypothetical protein
MVAAAAAAGVAAAADGLKLTRFIGEAAAATGVAGLAATGLTLAPRTTPSSRVTTTGITSREADAAGAF